MKLFVVSLVYVQDDDVDLLYSTQSSCNAVKSFAGSIVYLQAEIVDNLIEFHRHSLDSSDFQTSI